MKSNKFLLFRWLATQAHSIRHLYLLAALQGLLYLMVPLGLQGIVTYIMAGSLSASLIFLSVVIIIATALAGYLQIWQMRITETMQQTLFANLSSRIYTNSQFSADSFSLTNRFSEITSLQKSLKKILLDVSFSIISIVFGLIILPLYSNWFMFATLLLGGVFTYIILHYGKKSLVTSINSSNAKYQVWDELQQKSEKDRDAQQIEHFLEASTQHYQGLERQFSGITIFKIAFVGVLLLLGSYLVQHGELNIGQFLASEIILFLVINSIEKLVGSINTFYEMNTSLYKLDDFLQRTSGSGIIEEQELPASLQKHVYKHPYSATIKRLIKGGLIIAAVLLFLPWTQTVDSVGTITTLNPENRPQTITSRISGRIEKWYIREGQEVKKNDTIAFISEIKEDYFDPKLIERSQQIIKSKETTLESYQNKIHAVDLQIDALSGALGFKLEQTNNKRTQIRLKLSADSAEYLAAVAQLKVAEEQFKRYEDLSTKGVISKTDLENRRVKLQEGIAKRTIAENKLQSTATDLRNIEVELQSIKQDYQEKLMKAESDKFSVLSQLYEGEGSLTKLQNQLANYEMRQGFYYVLAPQDGFIAKTSVQGLGEIVKEGSALCQIMPLQDEEVAELYVSPMDLPLIQIDQQVQLQFDGWPAFVFSGWPGMSYGTYPAKVVSFDKALSENGKFRVLVKNSGPHWPGAIQIGGGVKGLALLSKVPLIYELWRKVNGFPPEFYQPLKKRSSHDKK